MQDNIAFLFLFTLWMGKGEVPVHVWNLWNSTGGSVPSFPSVSNEDGFLISASLSGVIISYPSGLRCTPSAL